MQKQRFQNKRRNYFIKKRFQARFILKFCFLIILTCLLMGSLIYFLSTRTMTASFDNLRLVAKSTSDFILPALALSSLIAIILISLGCVFIVLFISHRIAGPLYRFEKSVEQIASGDLTVNTRLREKDEIKVLAETLNEVISKLRDKITVSQQDVKQLKDQLAYVRKRLGQLGVSSKDIDEILGVLENRAEDLETTLAYFKV